jgi:hypothetical protein
MKLLLYAVLVNRKNDTPRQKSRDGQITDKVFMSNGGKETFGIPYSIGRRTDGHLSRSQDSTLQEGQQALMLLPSKLKSSLHQYSNQREMGIEHSSGEAHARCDN